MTTVQHVFDKALMQPDVRLFDSCSEKWFTHTPSLVVNAKDPLPPSTIGDVVFLHLSASWSRLPFVYLLREDIGKRKLVIVEQTYTRGFEACCVTNVRRFRSLLRLYYQLADAVVALSPSQAEWIAEDKLVPRAKVIDFSLPIDALDYQHLSPPVFYRDRPLRIFACGRLSNQSGFDVLINAINLLPPEFATLRIVGTGEDEPKLKRLARHQPQISFETSASDKDACLSWADIVVIPSRWEPSVAWVRQARCAARPIIASRIDSLEDELDVAWGELVPTDDTLTLASAIHQIARRPLHELGQAARTSLLTKSGDINSQWSRILAAVAK